MIKGKDSRWANARTCSATPWISAQNAAFNGSIKQKNNDTFKKFNSRPCNSTLIFAVELHTLSLLLIILPHILNTEKVPKVILVVYLKIPWMFWILKNGSLLFTFGKKSVIFSFTFGKIWKITIDIATEVQKFKCKHSHQLIYN